MVSVIIGRDIGRKREFVEALKNNLDFGLWGLNFKAIYPVDIKTEKDIKRELFQIPISGRGVVVLWDVDSLKPRPAKALSSLIEKLLSSGDVDYVFEGSGMYGSVSYELAKAFHEFVRQIGSIPESQNMFDVCRAILFSNRENAIKKFKALKLDAKDLPQFLGSFRSVVEREKRIGVNRKEVLSALLLEADMKAKFNYRRPMEVLDFLLINMARSG